MPVYDQTRNAALWAMREKHGYPRPIDDRRERFAKIKEALAATVGTKNEQGQTMPEPLVSSWPHREPLLNLLVERLALFGFGWERGERNDQNPRTEEPVHRTWITYKNFPTIGGAHPTLFDLFFAPLDIFDQYHERTIALSRGEGTQLTGHCGRLNRMAQTGIGYKGFDGVSWLAGTEALALPRYLLDEVCATGSAIFLLLDAAHALYGQDAQLTALLDHKLPPSIPALMHPGEMHLIRPDMVILAEPDGRLRCVITEIESCAAGQGMTHAMQLGYEQSPDMVDRFVEFLAGRSYLVAATFQWAEYAFDQAAFCAALRQRGVDAHVIFDRPLDVIDARAERTWHPNSAMHPAAKVRWRRDFLYRLRQRDFLEFVHGYEGLPIKIQPNTVVFRFGYFDTFLSPPEGERIAADGQALAIMQSWQDKHGATFINPLQFHLESKALMAAVHVPGVRTWIHERDEGALDVLQRTLAETHLLAPGWNRDWEDDVQGDRGKWLTKFAGWDGDNKSWGSRSLVFGRDMNPAEWRASLEERMAMPHPVVVQHVINSTRFNIGFADETGLIQMMKSAATRLTPFLLRGTDGHAIHAGSTITLRMNTDRIHGASDAVEAPVNYTDKASEDS